MARKVKDTTWMNWRDVIPISKRRMMEWSLLYGSFNAHVDDNRTFKKINISTIRSKDIFYSSTLKIITQLYTQYLEVQLFI